MPVYVIEDQCKSKLGKRMQHMRAERPDEWTMDEFIHGVEQLDAENKKLKEVITKCQQSIGAAGVYLRKAEYSKAMSEYKGICDWLDEMYK